MNAAVYVLNTAIYALCGGLLLRGYVRVKQRLLFWSGLCFSLLAVSNLLVFFDLVIFPTQVDLFLERLLIAVLAMVLLLYGLIWESDRIR